MENKEKSMFQEARMKLKLTRNKVADFEVNPKSWTTTQEVRFYYEIYI